MAVKWSTRRDRKSEEGRERRQQQKVSDVMAELFQELEQEQLEREAAEKANAPKFKRRF
jgi:hypothetical protein